MRQCASPESLNATSKHELAVCISFDLRPYYVLMQSVLLRCDLLTHLDVSGCSCSEDFPFDFFGKNLKHLSVSHNKLGPVGAARLAPLLAGRLDGLEFLDCSFNGLEDAGVLAIVKAVQKSICLR